MCPKILSRHKNLSKFFIAIDVVVLGVVVLGMKVGDEVVLDVVPRKNPEIEGGEREGIMAGGILEVAKVCLGLPLVWGRPIFVLK